MARRGLIGCNSLFYLLGYCLSRCSADLSHLSFSNMVVLIPLWVKAREMLQSFFTVKLLVTRSDREPEVSIPVTC